MRWVRTKRRFGAWCALVAITLQIVLSFGHAHRVEGFGSGMPFQAAAAIGSHTAIERSDPASNAGLALEYCAICVAIKMGASAVPPEAPVSAVPVIAGEAQFASPAEDAAWEMEHLLFQARAPPSA